MSKLICIVAASALLAAACSTSGTQPRPEQITTFTREDKGGAVVIHSSFGSSDIKNWRVLDNSTLVIETYSHGDLVATFAHPCAGIRFAETLGFSTLGPFDLDKSTRVLLPDGRWCHFKTLAPYVAPE